MVTAVQHRGPMSVAHYMGECLVNPTYGYYMKKDVFGARGDFITAPEVSQVFGEMLGIWVIATWQQLGSPSKLNLVEFGPGRGTLMSDVLRSISNIKMFQSEIAAHLIDASPHLRKIQQQTLSKCSAQVNWWSSLEEVPADGMLFFFCVLGVCFYCILSIVCTAPTIIVANEYLDALPIHKFQVCFLLLFFSQDADKCAVVDLLCVVLFLCVVQRAPQGWQEVLIEDDDDPSYADMCTLSLSSC